MVGLVDRVQVALVLGRVLGTVGHLTLPAGLAPQLAHLEGSRVTTNRVNPARTPANPPVNPQLLAPKLNVPG